MLAEKHHALGGVLRGNVFMISRAKDFSAGTLWAALLWKGKEVRRVNSTEAQFYVGRPQC